jgi:opacity protein-like surface antigen
VLLSLAGSAWSEDGGGRRSYLHVHFAESNPASDAHDAIGAAIGLNLGRYVGLELALDYYELFLHAPRGGKVAELSVFPIVPQVRLRYPLLGDRLVPYVAGGVGIGVTQLNDASVPIEWEGGDTDLRPLGNVGAGLEYFFTDDIAFGLDFKYVIAGSGEYVVGREEADVDLDAPILSFGLRLFYPERHPSSPAARAEASSARFYLGARAGGAVLADSHVTRGVRAEPEQPLLGSGASVVLGGALGVTIGRHAGIELSIEHHEATLRVAGVGNAGEYSLFPILVQPRVRYPLLDGRLEPYVLGGVGIELGEVNDGAPDGISGQDQTFVGALGTGFEYFLSGDISVGCEIKYVFSRGHELELKGGRTAHASFDSLLFTAGIRAYLLDL